MGSIDNDMEDLKGDAIKKEEEVEKAHENSKRLQKEQKEDRRPKKRKPRFHEDMFDETTYYFKNNMRLVYPYKFTFTTHAKLRWCGLKLIDVFLKEFHLETIDYYKNAIKIGKIKVNRKKQDESYILKNNDILETMVHRHEPPVLNEPIEFIRNDEEMLVINKPSSIPVHPCGRYRHNTIVFLLGKEHNLKGLHTIHRIDRLTSGILMFAKTPSKAKEIERQIKQRELEKKYLARVRGEFPIEEVTVNEPILAVSHKVGVCKVDQNGKECTTVFKRLSFNGRSSVVQCKPLTGRMHQIRVHLQWLGFPILNDPIYNHPTAWGENKGKDGPLPNIDDVIAELLRTRKDNSYDSDLNTDKPNAALKLFDKEADGHQNKKIKIDHRESISNDIENNITRNVEIDTVNVTPTHREKEETRSLKHTGEVLYNDSSADRNQSNQLSVRESKKNDSPNEPTRVTYTSRDLGEKYYDESCTECKRIWKEPLESELIMFLHALSYKGSNWEFKTSIPKWANQDWIG